MYLFIFWVHINVVLQLAGLICRFVILHDGETMAVIPPICFSGIFSFSFLQTLAVNF